MKTVTDVAQRSSEIWERLLEAIRSVKSLPEEQVLERGTRIRDELGIRSIELMTIIFELEEHYDINILQEAPEQLQTLGEAHELIAGLVTRREGAST